MLQFNKRYFLLTVTLFVIEVLIALYIKDKFIRPYVGDVLVVMLIYCFVKTFFKVAVIPVAIGVLLFAFTIEALQYIKIIELLGLENLKLAKIIIGTSFAWADILSYIAGFLITLISEKVSSKRTKI